jgi:H+/gluconate symporter-like permease
MPENKKLTEQEMQEIRDKIDRLKHLRDPWIQMLQLAVPLFITMILFIAGIMNTQSDNLLEVKYYNISFIQNSSDNISYNNEVIITPVKGLNKSQFHNLLNSMFTVPILIFFVLFIVYYFAFIYARYDNAIKNLYNQLTGFEEKQKDKSNTNVKNKMKKSFWKALWEPEDSRLFGELGMILGGFLIIKWADIITPNFQGKEWLYFAIGFLFVLFGVKLLRKEEKFKEGDIKQRKF